jgi:hypothetical protein
MRDAQITSIAYLLGTLPENGDLFCSRENPSRSGLASLFD